MSTRGTRSESLRGIAPEVKNAQGTRESVGVRAGGQISIWSLVQNPLGATSAVTKTSREYLITHGLFDHSLS